MIRTTTPGSPCKITRKSSLHYKQRDNLGEEGLRLLIQTLIQIKSLSSFIHVSDLYQNSTKEHK